MKTENDDIINMKMENDNIINMKMENDNIINMKMENDNIINMENILTMSNPQLIGLLTSSGKEQEELFRQARNIRHQYLGDEITLRGVIEISNICQKSCDFCAMRCNNKSLKRFRLDTENIIKTAKNIIDTGINTVFIQSGQDPCCDEILEEVIPPIANDLGADIILNVGERSKEIYKWYFQLGAKGFILKYETSDPELYENIAHEPLDERIQCANWIRDAGMKIGTGNIIGLPHQSLESLASDIRLTLTLKPDFASTSPFIPNKGTPLENEPLGNLDLALNTISILRIGLKNALIPAVSALEYIRKEGQLLGLNAGANVLTINFTPKSYRENYNIYNKDRFIVSIDHAINTAKKAGFKINSKMLEMISPKITMLLLTLALFHALKLLRVFEFFIN